MFERFTTRARHAVVLAQEEARRLSHASIDGEHLLLGLLGEPESIAARVLAQLGVTLDLARADVAALHSHGTSSPSGHIPFTRNAKKVLELSLREALRLGHNYIGTEHIVLAIFRVDPDGVANIVLRRRGATKERVAELVDAEIGRAAGKGSTAASAQRRRTPGAEAVLAVAEELAAPGPIGSHHLLEAMALVDDSLAAAALVAMGVDPEALAAKLDELGTEGTSDVSVEDAAARLAEVRIGEDEVVVVLRDRQALHLGGRLAALLGNPVDGNVATGSPLIGVWQANVEALRRLVERLEPEPETEAVPSGRAAIVQEAVRRRLRRRAG